MQNLTFSPWDSRYHSMLPESLSEEFFLKAQVEVEKAWLLTLMEEKKIDKQSEADLDKALVTLRAQDVERIEARTNHATRALVEAIAEKLKKAKLKQCASWVHVGLTSFDTVDTAIRWRLKIYFQQDFELQYKKLIKTLKTLARKHRQTPQVGRTHGQWAVPALFGLTLAEFVERLEQVKQRIDGDVTDLRGQASGAVGGYQASSLLFKNPLGVESRFLKRLGLKAHLGSLQVLPAEDFFHLASSSFSLCSVVAKLANDLRHLARSEIGEVAEGMSKGQVGSSTMPQKRNPWNLEHVCSLFKVAQSRYSLLCNDLVTEHQRDLTNSASMRFSPELFMCMHLMLLRMNKILDSVIIDAQAMQRQLDHAGSTVLAEAFYILATVEGVENAHDHVREAARQGEQTGEDIFEILYKKKLLPQNLSLDKLKEDVLRGPYLKLTAIESAWGR